MSTDSFELGRDVFIGVGLSERLGVYHGSVYEITNFFVALADASQKGSSQLPLQPSTESIVDLPSLTRWPSFDVIRMSPRHFAVDMHDEIYFALAPPVHRIFGAPRTRN